MKHRDHKHILREVHAKHKAEKAAMQVRIDTLETHNASLLETIKSIRVSHRIEIEFVQQTVKPIYGKVKAITPPDDSDSFQDWGASQAEIERLMAQHEESEERALALADADDGPDDHYCAEHDITYGYDDVCPCCEAEEDRLDISKEADYPRGELPVLTTRGEDDPDARNLPF